MSPHKGETARKLFDFFTALIIPALLIAAWQAATESGVPSVVMPPLSGVWVAFLKSISTGELINDMGYSLGRVLKGYLSASVTGVVIGSLMGMFVPVRKLLHPMITSLRQIPMMAWIPLFILWFGIGELEKIVVIVVAAFFPISENTFSGISNTPKQYLEVAKIHHMSALSTFWKIYLPSAMPQIFVGLKLGLSSSWMAVVAAEMIAASTGIGYRLSESRNMLRPEKVMVCMIIIGIVGILMNKLITKLFEVLTPWRSRDSK